MSPVVKMFGIPVAKVTEKEAVERIVEMAKRGWHADSPKTALIATLNVDFVTNAVSGGPFGGNDELWGYLKAADFSPAQ